MSGIARDIKDALAFYQALGFERLPLRLKTSGGSLVSVNKQTAMKLLRTEIGDCKRCKLSHKRTHIVFGEGSPDARLMFIGEAPGREEDVQGKPFVGEAGVVLTRLIEKMGFKREEVFIANIIKCRPPMNRDPERDEIEQCFGFLQRQIDIVGPDVIMTLGRIAAAALTGNEKLKITMIRGRRFDYRGIPCIPTFHPAYLMRNPKDKWLTWNDAQEVLAILEQERTMPGMDV